MRGDISYLLYRVVAQYRIARNTELQKKHSGFLHLEFRVSGFWFVVLVSGFETAVSVELVRLTDHGCMQAGAAGRRKRDRETGDWRQGDRETGSKTGTVQQAQGERVGRQPRFPT